jgi:hypothetical protein
MWPKKANVIVVGYIETQSIVFLKNCNTAGPEPEYFYANYEDEKPPYNVHHVVEIDPPDIPETIAAGTLTFYKCKNLENKSTIGCP